MGDIQVSIFIYYESRYRSISYDIPGIGRIGTGFRRRYIVWPSGAQKLLSKLPGREPGRDGWSDSRVSVPHNQVAFKRGVNG